MKRRITTIILTLAVIAATLCLGLTMTACDKKAESYTFTVTYENGTPVNGLTDGTAGVTASGEDGTEVQIQICAANPDTHEVGFCNAPKAIGADGKLEFKKSDLNEEQRKSNEKWHVQINGADNYTYEDLYLDGYGEYTIVLVAKN